MGFNLNVKGLANMPYNASGAGGLTFWMKSDVAVGISVTEPATIPGSAGGTCADSADALNCDNPFHFFLFGRLSPTDGSSTTCRSPRCRNGARRTRTEILSSSVDWSPTSLVDVQFLRRGRFVDVWVDDIRFYPCPGSGCAPHLHRAALPVPCAASGGVPAGCWPEKSDAPPVGVLEQGFTGLWGSGPGDVWTVGGPRFAPSGGTVGRWDGTTWSIFDDSSERLGSVWGSGPDDVLAVEERGHFSLGWRGLVVPARVGPARA